MPNHQTVQEFETLLARFNAGEATSADVEALGLLCSQFPELGKRLRDELEFSEMIRQTLITSDDESFASDVRYRLSADRTVGFASLEEKIFQGEATRPDLNALAMEIGEDESRARSLRDDLIFDDLLSQAVVRSRDEEPFVTSLATRMWAETNEDHFVQDIESRLRLVDEPVSEDSAVVPFPGKTQQRKKRSWIPGVAMGLGVAACAAMGMLLLQSGQFNNRDVVAEITRSSSDAVWSDAESPLSNGEIASGKRYKLQSGVSSFKFKNGAEITVEGPAEFEVVDDRQAIFHSGVALARTGSVEGGFSLQSKGINLVNSGNSIGIDARSDHSTEAMIFNQGEGVGVCLPGMARCRELYQYEAIRADLDRDKLLDIPYNPRAFSRAWELVAGVEKNTGSVRLELPGSGIERDRGNLESVQIYVENDSFHASKKLQVDSLKTGQFATASGENAGEELQSESELRSYLVQLWPSQVRENVGPVEASITFDHPVVGVIYSSDRLEKSDSVVGTHMGDHNSSARGLDSGDDEILLSDDRRTMNVRLKNGNVDDLDHIRVLVALN